MITRCVLFGRHPHRKCPCAPIARHVIKQEDRRKAVTEMRRLAELSEKKASAMIARRARREKARVLRAWRRLQLKQKNRKATKAGTIDVEASPEAGTRGTGTNVGSPSGSKVSGGSLSTSGSSASSSSTSSGSFSSSSSSFSLSSQQAPVNNTMRLTEGSSAPPKHLFPVPSAAEAAQAGRANASLCFQAETERTNRVQREGAAVMAPVEVAAKMVCKALHGGRSGQSFYTPEMRALARFEWQRRTHEAKNTRAIYGTH